MYLRPKSQFTKIFGVSHAMNFIASNPVEDLVFWKFYRQYVEGQYMVDDPLKPVLFLIFFVVKNAVIEKHIVKYKGHEVFNINELEHVNGEVWANVWQTDCIARISIKDGQILGWIYLPNLREGLIAAGHKGIDVLNGIAWDQEQNRIFVTGKLWPELYGSRYIGGRRRSMEIYRSFACQSHSISEVHTKPNMITPMDILILLERPLILFYFKYLPK